MSKDYLDGTSGKHRPSSSPSTKTKRLDKTKLHDHLFVDDVSYEEKVPTIDYDTYLKRLWDANSEIYQILVNATDLKSAREKLYTYLEQAERWILSLDNTLHILEKSTVRECIRVFRSVIAPINEYHTEYSALDTLIKLSQQKSKDISRRISVGFILEFIHLFRGVRGHSHIYNEHKPVKKGVPQFLKMEGRDAALIRMEMLDEMGSGVMKYFKKYPSGLDEEVVSWRAENKARILRYFKGSQADWQNYLWHLKNVINTARPLIDLIELTDDQKEAVEKVEKHGIPFGITPHYLSLMDRQLSIGHDHAIRAQVIPPKDYVDKYIEQMKDSSVSLDFMGEQDSSPVDLITRRYPLVSIIKPFNTCAQICVYCQRNWEIECVLEPKAMPGRKKLDVALAWFDKHKSVGDVLISGGDPLIMKDSQIKYILEALSAKKHIYRIRIGSRTPVVLPMRFTDALVEMLGHYHQPPHLEIALVTHYEHSYEITPDSLHAVQKLRKAGISVYNQQVYTMENSRRFELAKLRRDLKSIGIDPYYTFNMKGKEETRRYMVPVARILQERKEETRLLPGLDRTDEPIFNLPRLGKNYLRAAKDRRMVMILPDGSRVYEFHPWEKNIEPIPPYNYVDVPIYDYLEELGDRGENIREYRTIWYYY
jgi:lysine 2,3-aminomutase